MEDEAARSLQDKAAEVLKQNDRGQYTVPAGDLYPHQWLWDSCFIAIGLRHENITRSQTEIRSMMLGQWSNGMIPHMIFSTGADDSKSRERERSQLSPYAPDNIETSGITQPPMLAEAVVKIGQKLKVPERRSWYKEMLEPLVRYHEWLYADRDPHKEGLVLLIHPYECGLDDSPPWISELRKHSMPLWVNAFERLRLGWVANFVRRDTKYVSPGQRMSNIEAMAYWAAMRRIRRKAYNSEAILSRSLFAVEDLAFNSILVRANHLLRDMAKYVKHELPADLIENMARTENALQQLWDESSGQYFSRSFVSHKLIEEPTIATFLPLYSGAISKDHVAKLVELLKKPNVFSLSWPVPSVPRTSTYFNPYRYWQGPTWVNTNWLIIEGLKNYGYHDEAKILQSRTIELVDKSGFYEYFNPLDGNPAGAANFSWTAALTIDLLKS